MVNDRKVKGLILTSNSHMTHVRWVSMIIPIYNTKTAFLKQAIDSIFNQNLHLETDGAQQQLGIELILINDGSNLDCSNIIQELTVPFYTHPYFVIHHIHFLHNQGIGSALQSGVQHCSHSLIFRMDSDDIALPNRVREQVKYMDAHPECPACGTQIQLFRHLGCLHPPSTLPLILTKDEFVRHPMDWFVAHPTMCYRQNVLQHVGGYNPSMRSMIEDYDLHMRILKLYGRLDNLPNVLLHYRNHEDQVTTKALRNGEIKMWESERQKIFHQWMN